MWIYQSLLGSAVRVSFLTKLCETMSFKKCYVAHFELDIYCCRGSTLRVVCMPCESLLEKSKISASSYQLEVRIRLVFTSLCITGTHACESLCMLPQSLEVHICSALFCLGFDSSLFSIPSGS